MSLPAQTRGSLHRRRAAMFHQLARREISPYNLPDSFFPIKQVPNWRNGGNRVNTPTLNESAQYTFIIPT